MVLAIAAELDYEVYMLDVQTAFLNADVDEEVFVKMAPGYERSNESGIPLVMLLLLLLLIHTFSVLSLQLKKLR